MAKRATGVGKMKRSTSHKTAKRLEIKKAMLEEKGKKTKHKKQRRKVAKKNNTKV
ncbi:MAG: hypothetical protein ACKKL6_00110 [Candidatus Komeilibacteria bacterium]